MTANGITSDDDMGAARGQKPPTRLRNPSPDDATGKRILNAGLTLIDEGLAIHEVRLVDACERATSDDPSRPITTGAAYPRFPRGQNEFRLCLLSELLRRDHGRHRRAGSDRAHDELEDLVRTHQPVPPAGIREYIEHHGSGQIERIGDDPTFPLRLYAMRLLADREDFPERDDLLAELRALDADSDSRWTNSFKVIMLEYGWSARQEFEPDDFELLLGALATGLAVKRLIAPPDELARIDHLYASFIAAAAIGFFGSAEDDDPHSVWAAFADRLKSSRAAMRDEMDQHALAGEND